MKSPKLAINVLIDLNNKGLEPIACFDFISKHIAPKHAETKDSLQLLNDYIDWLPKHFINHNCDLSRIEKLQIHLWTDFYNAETPPRMSNYRIIQVKTKTIWKAYGREEMILEISQGEIIKDTSIKYGLPEL